MAKCLIKLVTERIAWSTSSCAERIAGLGHEPRNDAMEGRVVKESLACQEDKVVDGGWHPIGVQLRHNVALFCNDGGLIGLGGIYDQLGRRAVHTVSLGWRQFACSLPWLDFGR